MSALISAQKDFAFLQCTEKVTAPLSTTPIPAVTDLSLSAPSLFDIQPCEKPYRILKGEQGNDTSLILCCMIKISLMQIPTFSNKYFRNAFFSKKDVEILTKVIHTIVLLLNDSNVMVVKKVMLCLTQLYRLMLLVSRRMLGLPNQLHTCQIFNLPPEMRAKIH